MHEILYAQMPQINANAEVSSDAGSLKFRQSIYLHPYFVHAFTEDPGESCADSPEASLLADVISTDISCKGSNYMYEL